MASNQVPTDWSHRAKIACSLAIVFHLSCVFVGPWSNPPPSTQISRDVAMLFSPYIKFFALDNGYRFFAPDPGPSHLVRYELRMSDGSTESGRFPDPENHWPRLLYHRHFMLAETMFTLARPVLDAPALTTMTADEREGFQRHKLQVELLQSSVAQYLLRQHPEAQRVRLFIQVHEIPSPDDVLGGRPLDDPALYQEFLLGEYER